MIPGTTHILSNYCLGKVIYSLAESNLAYYTQVCSYINYMEWIGIGSSIGNKIRSILFQSLMENSVTFFDTHMIGELLTLLSFESVFSESKTVQLRCLGLSQCNFCKFFYSLCLCQFNI